MTEMLQHEPGRRFLFGRARLACLLVLLGAGIGLLANTALVYRNQASADAAHVSGSVNPEPRSAVRGVAACPTGSLREILAHPDIIPTHHHPLLGRPAPDFELADSEGKVRSLTELREGQPVVLIFYYGFHCIHCVRHLHELDRDLPLFHEAGARVVAISADPPDWTRRRFEQHGRFGFPVLADPGKSVAEAYGVFKPARDATIGDVLRHGTFVIDRRGTIRWVNVGDAPFRRSPALLCQLARLEGRLP